MAKDTNTEFFYYINGTPYLLTPGKEGITQEVITVLRDSYHAEHLNNRYEDENQDSRFNFAQSLYSKKPLIFAQEPLEGLEDQSHDPESVFFQEELPPSIRDRVHELLPLLIPEQQELYWRLCEGRKLVDIAREEGTTDNAIRSRRRKMIKRIQLLYAEKFGNE